jgi:hypothetical protein
MKEAVFCLLTYDRCTKVQITIHWRTLKTRSAQRWDLTMVSRLVSHHICVHSRGLHLVSTNIENKVREDVGGLLWTRR